MVSSHVWLILVPIVLDVFLWLGPRLSAGNLFTRSLTALIDVMSKMSTVPPQDPKSLTDLADVISRLNWLAWIRTFPIGVSSLKAFAYPADLPLQTPLGLQSIVQIGSVFSLLGWMFLLTIVGWVAGGLYFRWVSVTTLGREAAGITPIRALVQTLILSLIWTVGTTIILVPVLLVVSLMTAINVPCWATRS